MAATHSARSMSLASFRAGHAVRVDAERAERGGSGPAAESRTGYPIDATAQTELPTGRLVQEACDQYRRQATGDVRRATWATAHLGRAKTCVGARRAATQGESQPGGGVHLTTTLSPAEVDGPVVVLP